MLIDRQCVLPFVASIAVAWTSAHAVDGRAAAPAPDRDPAWASAHKKPPMTAKEPRAFIMRLARFVVDNHMRKAEKSPQRGMIYEYFHVSRKDKDEQVNLAGRNDLAGRPNPRRLLSGYSHGSSNHMAQDLAVMLEQAWLLLLEGKTDWQTHGIPPAQPARRRLYTLAGQLAETRPRPLGADLP